MAGNIDASRQALRLMQEALALLDIAQAPADIGAHLDLAIERLHENLGSGQNPVGFKPQAAPASR